jgi:hypothetical protein
MLSVVKSHATKIRSNTTQEGAPPGAESMINEGGEVWAPSRVGAFRSEPGDDAGVTLLSFCGMLNDSALGEVARAVSAAADAGRVLVLDMSGACLATTPDQVLLLMRMDCTGARRHGPVAVVMPALTPQMARVFAGWAESMAQRGALRRLYPPGGGLAAREWAAEEAAISRSCARGGRPAPGWRQA